MKKVLSLILAIAMVLSLAPQIFAADTGASAEPDITFLPEPAGSEHYMKFESHKNCGTPSVNAERIRVYFPGGTTSGSYAAFAIRINVPVTGKYALSINANSGGTRLGYANVYMAKVNEDESYAGGDLYATFAKSVNYIGEYSGVGDVGLQNVEYTFEEGNYLLVFTPSAKNEECDGYSNGIRNYIKSITLTKVEEVGNTEEEITDTTVNFKASAYEGGSVDKTDVQEVTIGTDVTVTATANDGYTFAYWKNSAGVVLSTSATETFKVNTNMGVIAVFDKTATADAEIPVYFYNGNGLPLGNAEVEKNTTFGAAKEAARVPAKPTLTGFVFKHWSNKDEETPILDTDEITALTRAVAIYEDADTTFTVKNGDVIVTENAKYGESITVNGSENFSCWKLGDKVVSYEKNYSFDVYGDITLTEVTGEAMAKAPVLVLDEVDGNYFLTYDEGDYELIEAGILFGSENVSIGSIDGYKAAAKKGTGQFTAQPHEGATSATVARGYMIVKDRNGFKVIYAD